MSQMVSNLDAFERKLERAVIGGLVAAQTVVQNAVKESLRGGFTSGAFVTGNLQNSVTKDEPHVEGGDVVGRVGTNVPYALPWELGHANLFTRRHERVEKWRPALVDSREAAGAAFARVVARILGDGTSATGDVSPGEPA